ncbi:MAG: hypothetical protein JSR80_00800 [Verrucomicrobia bacterium]|nr:hypothetical protein [Verrucomicrobiota bacterium]
MKIRCWKGLFAIGMLITCPANIQAAFPVQEQCKSSPTYFQYNSSEIKELSQKSSDERMSEEELIKWDGIDLPPKVVRSKVDIPYFFVSV